MDGPSRGRPRPRPPTQAPPASRGCRLLARLLLPPPRRDPSSRPSTPHRGKRALERDDSPPLPLEWSLPKEGGRELTWNLSLSNRGGQSFEEAGDGKDQLDGGRGGEDTNKANPLERGVGDAIRSLGAGFSPGTANSPLGSDNASLSLFNFALVLFRLQHTLLFSQNGAPAALCLDAAHSTELA